MGGIWPANGLVLLSLGCLAVFCIWFARRNYLAYALLFLLLALREPLLELFAAGNRALEVQGLLAAGVLLAVCVWAVLPSLGRAPRVGHAAAQA